MRASTIVATALVAASPSLASALTYGGNAIIVNQCDYPLNVWSVDQTFFPTDNDRQTIAPHSNWSEPLRVPAAGCNCGVSIKISKGETYARPIVQFEYTIAEASSTANMFQSYDISFVDCSEATPQIAAVNGYSSFTGADCPAWDEGIKIYGTGSGCPTMSCPAGEFCPYDAYFEPEPKNLNGPQPVRQCPHGDLSSDIVFVTCSDKQASSDDTPASSSPSSSSPAYTPSSTPTPSSTSSSAVVTPAVFAQITDGPKAADVSTQGHVVVQVVWVTAYVNEYGVRVNEDGSKYLGRRFMA